MTDYHINEQGLGEIAAFLATAHRRGASMTREHLLAWADEAENSLAAGNPAMIEVRTIDSASGRPETFTVSDAGIERIEVES